MFFSNVEQLCNAKGLRISNLCDNLHISRGNIARWKSGTTPTASMLKKIADYFGVTTDYLLTGSDNKKSSEPQPEDDFQFALLDGTKELSKEAKQDLLKYKEYLLHKYIKK
jgi:transcriptional regulator with XRE-family HTH domain